MKYSLSLPIVLAILLVSALGSLPALAGDPPALVGRISYLEGQVSFRASENDDWSLAALNYPVTTGASFWTGAQGRGEVQAGAAEIRLDNATELNVVELDDGGTRLELPQGVINIRVHAVPVGGSIDIMTPTGPVSLVHPGTYHIDAGQPIGNQPPSRTLVTTLEGQVQVRGPNAVLEVMRGETAIIQGNPPTYTLEMAATTPFDDWALMLEKREDAAMNSGVYVSPYMTGSEDLNRYGRWGTAPDYGPVWYPTTVVEGWAPYRYGHWAFVRPWGWTWIDDAPWGFAPFHYGRWIQIGGRWGWAPGQIVDRPVYSPALVAFVGGPGWGVSLSLGGGTPIGWVPLAPHEVFHPWYPVSTDYVAESTSRLSTERRSTTSR